MLKKFIYIFLLGTLSSMAQSNIAVQSFESSGDTWTSISFSTPPCTVGNDIWDYVSSLPGINSNEGSQFWGIRDLDGNCGSNGFETLTLANVNVSANSNVTFAFDYYAIGFDINEDLKYELFFDNVSQGEVLVVDGVGGNSDNTNGWLTETVSIPTAVTDVSVILSAKSNHNNERAGFDNVRLYESAIANNDCQSSTNLIVGASNTENVITGTNVGATSSGQLPNPTCASFQGNDVWYTAQVPANGIISVETLDAGSSIDTAIEIYSGNCGNLTQLACHDDKNYPSDLYSRIDLSGLPNTTIYIRVWAWSNSSSGDFNIVAYSSPPVANNDCFDAQDLTVGTNNTQNVVTGTNVNASASGELPNPNCANYNGRDVWYSATIPASGILTVETQNAGSGIDTGLAIYSGSCGALSQIDCDDDSGPGLYSTINLTGLPNTTVYIRVWSYNNSTEGDFNIVAYSPECPFSTRWNGSSWNNGAPNSFTSAIINGNYDTAVNGSFETCNLTVNNNRTVNITADNHITVYNDLIINGSLDVRHEASLLMTDDNALVNIPGNINVHKTTSPFKQYDYTYWSSPMANETIGSALAESVANRIYEFDTTIYNEISTNGWTSVNGSTQMGQGIGYIAMGPTSGTFPRTQDVIFDGQVNNGLIETTINLSADSSKDYEDWNLIGNPYPSALDANILLGHPLNTSIVSGTIYLWTHNTARNTNSGEQDYNSNDYATYTFGTGGVAASTGGEKPTGLIASGQGFFIDGINTGNISFNNSMRVNSGNDQFFRAPASNNSKVAGEDDKIWLDLKNSKGAFSQTLIGFIDGATDGLDREYDGIKFGGGWVSFYSIAHNKNLAIQGKNPIVEDQIIPLGFASFVEEGELLKVSIADLEGRIATDEYEVLLKDKTLDITHDLKEKDYEFSSDEKGVFNERFELMIKQSTVLNTEEAVLDNRLIVYSNDDQIHIRNANNSIITKFIAYDLVGKKLIEKSPNKSEFIVNTRHIDKGTVLIINSILEGNIVLSSKFILH